VAGVSRATVSRVINGAQTVDPAMRRAVERAIADTRYVPNRAPAPWSPGARAPSPWWSPSASSGRSRTPSSADVHRPPLRRVVSGVLDVLRPAGTQMLLMLATTTPPHPARQLPAPGPRRRRHPHLLTRRRPAPRACSTAPDCPPSWPSRPAQPTQISYVDRSTSKPAPRSPPTTSSPWAPQHRLPSPAPWTCRPPGPPRRIPRRDGRPRPARRHLRRRRLHPSGRRRRHEATPRRTPRPRRVFIASDLMALGALPVLYRQGRPRPRGRRRGRLRRQQCALACDPPLTTVRQPVEDGRRNGPSPPANQRAGPPDTSVIFQPALVARQSPDQPTAKPAGPRRLG